jgi:hypothetical protein
MNYKEKFLQNAQTTHGDLYGYDLIDYKGALIKVEIVCSTHGSFWQLPSNHLRYGCNKCGSEKTSNKNRKGTMSFIERAVFTHKDLYDYSKVVYVRSDHLVVIICKEHGEFLQTPITHIHGAGCPFCARITRADHLRLGKEEFTKRAQAVHNYKYDYTQTVYINNNTKVSILCNIHGLFEQVPSYHLLGGGCLLCKPISRGEQCIDKLLKSNNISFRREYEFIECVNPLTGRNLRYDFFLPTHQILIEFDGEHHFKPVTYSHLTNEQAIGNLKVFEARDAIKTRFALENSLRLIRIHYKDFKSIEAILKAALNI